ncbi:HDIG domain-containing protein [bacterium]|nr:HDIG domain-containing protein [bacterium]
MNGKEHSVRKPVSQGEDSRPAVRHGTSRFAGAWSAFCQRRVHRPIISCVGIIILTILLVPKRHIVDFELYSVGEIARHDLWAPEEMTIEDHETTAAKRRAASESEPFVYDYDEMAVSNSVQKLRTTFSIVRDGLARRNQLIEALKRSKSAESEVGNAPASDGVTAGEQSAQPDAEEPADQPEIKPTIEELRALLKDGLGVEVSREDFDLLASSGFNGEVENCMVAAFSAACRDGVVADKSLLIDHSANGITARNVGTGVANFLPPSEVYAIPDVSEARSRALRAQAALCPDFRELRPVLTGLLSGLVRPTLTFSKSATEKNKSLAEAAVEPVYYKIKKGQMIVRAREMVTARHHEIIRKLIKNKKPGQRIYSAIGTPLFLGIVVLVFYLIGDRLGPDVVASWKNELLFWVIIVLTVLIAKGFLWGLRAFVGAIEQPPFNLIESYYFATPLGLSVVLSALLLGKKYGLRAALLAAVFVPLLFGNRPVMIMAMLLSGLSVLYIMGKYESDSAVFKMGLLMGGVGAATIMSLQILSSATRFSSLGNFNALCGFAQGLLVVAITGVLLPVLELVFGVWTRAKLLDLASTDRPLIKRLMIEAGGTHNHSLRVGELARNASEAVGANGVVALVGSYYHDIGKLRRPGYFIENTPAGGVNPHDNLTPEMSVRILREHVSNGVALAKENRLPPVIIDSIQQHHGMSLMRLFYHKALEAAKRNDETVNPSDFRYPGPKPMSREAGILMIADSVEAASRVLVNPTGAKIAKMVDKIAAWYVEDHQLDDCDLTLKDIAACKKSFVVVLQGMFHSRVEYPEEEGSENGQNRG